MITGPARKILLNMNVSPSNMHELGFMIPTTLNARLHRDQVE